MFKTLKTCTIAAILLATAAGAVFAMNPKVGGAAMFETKNIVENAVNSPDHTTLVAAVKAAGLVDTLMGDGPFTVFAPTNEAFAALPDGVVDSLLEPENMTTLQKVLTYHVVPGRITTADLKRMVAENDGVYIFETVAGTKLSAQVRGDTLYIGDKDGHNATVTISDVIQSNGVIHVVDKVLLPL